MNTLNTTSSARRGLALALATFAVAAIAALGPAGAQAATMPSHQIGSWFYDSNGLGVYPPKSMSPTRTVTCYDGETVKWSPDLQRWNGSSWVNYNTSAPFYEALTSSYGYCYFQALYGYWWNPSTFRTMQFHRFGKLPAGYYRIKHWMYWKALGATFAETDAWFTVN